MSRTADDLSSLQQTQSRLLTPPNASKPASLTSVYAPIVAELKQVETILKTELRSETPFVDQLLEHSWLLGGKRIRPVFLLLSGAAVGNLTDAHYQLAAALEMIHTATLVHDDILDEADTRRHRPTANSVWGAKQSVLLGDYLFTHSFDVAAKGGSCKALQMLAQASNRVCEGEMRQNAWQGDFNLSQQDYLRMITEKTAELCGVGCRIGAFLSGADEEIVNQFESYGRNLGVAFQIIDDVLDIVGQDDKMGKTLGTDLLNQKPTLPVIHCLENLPANQAEELVRFLQDPKSTAEQLQGYLNRTDSLEYARLQAREHAQAAVDFAKTLEANEFADALIYLADFVQQRSF
ncbi:polyprenyl synthetase family protein [Mariniblastus sp.]|nr:polyprenyl synthetase family protein [Mariniblastus sp.]